MSQEALTNLALAALGGYVFKLWLDDYHAAQAGRPNPQAFPGAAPAPAGLIVLGVLGALGLLAAETVGEITLGIAGEQSDIVAVALLGFVAAAFYEELIFRGYLVVTRRGRAAMLGAAVGLSVAFALLHPFLWQWEEGALRLDFSLKAWWSTGTVFAFSLWLYYLRLAARNAAGSIVPCIAAHLAKNLGVFGVKLAQGHVTGWW